MPCSQCTHDPRCSDRCQALTIECGPDGVMASVPAEVQFTPEEARRGYAWRGDTKHYCCYGMYCDAGHTSDCKHAAGVAEPIAGAARNAGVRACPESGKHCNVVGGECRTCGAVECGPLTDIHGVVAGEVAMLGLTDEQAALLCSACSGLSGARPCPYPKVRGGCMRAYCAPPLGSKQQYDDGIPPSTNKDPA